MKLKIMNQVNKILFKAIKIIGIKFFKLLNYLYMMMLKNLYLNKTINIILV